MTVLGLPQYFDMLVENKVTSLAKLRRKFGLKQKPMKLGLKRLELP